MRVVEGCCCLFALIVLLVVCWFCWCLLLWLLCYVAVRRCLLFDDVSNCMSIALCCLLLDVVCWCVLTVVYWWFVVGFC